MTDTKGSTKLGAVVAVIVAIITCLGTIIAAIIAILPDILRSPTSSPPNSAVPTIFTDEPTVYVMLTTGTSSPNPTLTLQPSATPPTSPTMDSTSIAATAINRTPQPSSFMVHLVGSFGCTSTTLESNLPSNVDIHINYDFGQYDPSYLEFRAGGPGIVSLLGSTENTAELIIKAQSTYNLSFNSLQGGLHYVTFFNCNTFSYDFPVNFSDGVWSFQQ